MRFMLRETKYGYSNARVRAMYALLLSNQFILDLAKLGTIEEVIEQLERTYYKEELVEESRSKHGSDIVQFAASRHFIKTVNKIRKLTPSEDLPAFESFLLKWRINNAKILLNAWAMSKPVDEVLPFLIPTETFSEEKVRELLESKGVQFFKELSKTPFGKEMFASGLVSPSKMEELFLNAEKDKSKIIEVETMLDKYYYDSMVARVKKEKELHPLLPLIREEIDFKNAMIIGRLKAHGISDPAVIRRNLIQNSSVKWDVVLENKSMEQFFKLIAKQFNLKEVDSLPQLEMEFEKKLVSDRLKLFLRSILSLTTIISFLFLKENEINNLRKIAVGKEFNLSSEKIIQMLVFAR